MTELAGGTLTFFLSDVEGSTALLRRLRESYAPVLAEHQRLLRDAVAEQGGRELDSHADSFFAAFSTPRAAVLAALAAQRSLASHDWPEGATVRVRIGVHTGLAEVADGRYVGLAVHRTARLCAAGHGGQILLSHATVAVLEDDETELDVELRDLGPQRLKDFERPVRVYEAVGPGRETASAPLRSKAGRASPPALRASDADRERTVAALREHAALGRLTLEEFSERAERALAAPTLEELEAVALDLPAAAVPEERPRRRPRVVTGAFFSSTERTGRWRLPRFSLALVVFGNADLDLRQAELRGHVVSLTALVLWGNIDVYVPEGVEVDVGGLAIVGHRREHGHDAPPLRGTPLLRVRIFSLFGTADIWRVPLNWGRRTFGEVIRAFGRVERGELPPAG